MKDFVSAVALCGLRAEIEQQLKLVKRAEFRHRGQLTLQKRVSANQIRKHTKLTSAAS